MCGVRFARAATVAAAVMILCVIAGSANAIMLVSRKDEVQIGKQVEADVTKQYGGLSKDRAVTERVARVGKQVAAAATRKDVTYTYKVVDSDVINAFAAPGGPVIITRKLVQLLTTDDELAFVLAHETGHIAAQHGRQAINRALIAQGLASILFQNASDSVKTGVNIMYTLYDRGYSRDQEYQADSLGVQFMTSARFNPEGAVTALAKLGMSRTKGIDKYLSTHPDAPDRIDRVAKLGRISKERKDALVKQVQGAK